MVVELEADLNADPTNEFVTRGEGGRNGLFRNDTVFALAKDAEPVLWWKIWGSAACSELTTVAMRILAQPTTWTGL